MNKYRFYRDGGGPRGFTLVELIFIMAIMAILVGLALPGIRTMLAKRTVTSQAEALAAGLRLARSEALKRGGQPVTMCASDDPEAPKPECTTAQTNDWAKGWIIFTDHTANLQKLDADKGEMILKVQPAFATSGGIGNNATSAISFNQNGMVTPALANSTFTVNPKMAGTVDQLKNIIRCVVVSTSGRARIQNANDQGICK